MDLINLIIKPIKKVLRKVFNYVIDIYESLTGIRDELTPPRSMIFIGAGDFKKIGEEFCQYFIEKGKLKQDDHVLDVGCGIGRMAVPLTKYLSNEGRYEGFDIVDYGINWCIKRITYKYPNFRFHLADVFNKFYNPKGKNKPANYKFPYKDNSFDFIFLTSVFTHMLPAELENYLSEISRVLKSKGKCLITFFLLNEESLLQIEKKQSKFDFKYNLEDCQIQDKNLPEDAVSYKEEFVRNLYKKYDLEITEPIHYGSWCGRKDFLSFQDIIVAIK